jgi:hypothetical protein
MRPAERKPNAPFVRIVSQLLFPLLQKAPTDREDHDCERVSDLMTMRLFGRLRWGGSRWSRGEFTKQIPDATAVRMAI